MAGQFVISMDGAECWVDEDGSVQIKKTTGTSWVAIVLLVSFVTFFAVILTARMNPENVGRNLAGLLAITIAVLALLIPIMAQLRVPPVRINAPSKMLSIGRDPSARQIEFSSVSQIRAAGGYVHIESEDTSVTATTVGIQAVLTSGETIKLGSVSGKEDDTRARAATIIKLIAKTMNVEADLADTQ